MYVHVPKWQSESQDNSKPFQKVPDHLNKAVQELIDFEVHTRSKYNSTFMAKIFGKRSVDRMFILNELKSAHVMQDDRYLLATLSRERI